MVLIIGGAWQGKLDFARERFAIRENEIFTCDGSTVDFSFRCINRLEEFARLNPDPIEYFVRNRALWQENVLILRDVFCGVVPMGEENRAWRQRAGRFAQYLSREATQVSRIFCGLEQRLK